jgi:hypothetical protein
MNNTTNLDELKRFIAGRELDIAIQLGILMDGKGKEHKQYCPFCPKSEQKSGERFYVRTENKTSFHCRQCFNGDIFSLIMKSHNVDFNEAKRLIADSSGFINATDAMHVRHAINEVKKSVQEGKPIPPTLDTYRLDGESPVFKAVQAHRPDISFSDYKRAGAKLFRDGIAIPMFDNDGVTSGWVRFFTDGSKKNSFGSTSGVVGVDAIFNLRTAKSARIIFKTAGVSDFLVLSGAIERLGLEADYYAFTNGAGEGEHPDKFEPLLRPALTGQSVGVIQDNDEAGTKGAQRWAESLAEYAADVRIIRLPLVVFDCPTKDLRDFFSTDGTAFSDLLF